MGSILSYRDALKYREEPVPGKINHEKNQDIVRKTIQHMETMKSQQRMTKEKELKSNIFWLTVNIEYHFSEKS